MEMISEAHVFAEKSGLGTEVMETLFKENYGELAYTMSKRITSGTYCPPKGTQPWSDLNLAIKDVGHGITCAEKSGTRLEIGEVALEHLKAAKEWADSDGRGGGRALDSSAMYGILRENAGLDFESSVVKLRDGSS